MHRVCNFLQLPKRMVSLQLFTFFCSLILSTIIELSFATDIITRGQSVRDGENLISSSQIFELGFFSPGNSSNRYLGIWYKISPGTVVWVANRKNPIVDKQGVLTFSNNGSLVLVNKNKSIIWSSKASRGLENPMVQLLDSGNLVIRDSSGMGSESYIWQSFDYPSDTLLQGMKLGWNLKTAFERRLTPWRSADDPSPGEFSLSLDIDGAPQLAIDTPSRKIVRSGPWNGVLFGGIPLNPKTVSTPKLVHNEDELYFTFELFDNTVISRLMVDQSGNMQRFVWNGRSREWTMLYSWPYDMCDNYAECGANGYCGIDKKPMCACLNGFVPESENEFGISQTAKCIKKSPIESDCRNGEGFLKLVRMKLPDNNWSNQSMNIKECERECLKNCSCRAYANPDMEEKDTGGCLMWFGDLIDMKYSSEGFTWGQNIFIRVPASELAAHSGTSTDPGHKTNKKSRKHLWIMVIILIIPLTVVSLSLIIVYVRRKLKRKEGENLLLFDLGMSLKADNPQIPESTKLGKSSKTEVKLPLFSFASVSAATNNFSVTNKLGEGGFGPVYKGILLTGDEIAVKRLSRRSGQGWEELRNEAVLIAKLQHKNLVRLLGCCIEGDEKILIYEYMTNKSLDFFLFDPTKQKVLDCRTRIYIIEGIAQGLLYLHQHSRIRIIHRDLKASNILLDKDMNPKISDFGMARIFRANELQANTNRIVGTYGYMSPEYALEGVFSIKSDVFSFGVLLLEILSGKKNTGFYQTDSLNLLGYAWDMWINDKGLDLMDPVIEEASSKQMLLRYVNIGLLCVQESAEDRPSMSEVVSMLSNESSRLPSPKQPAFSYLRTANSRSPISRPESYSVNNVTVTSLKVR